MKTSVHGVTFKDAVNAKMVTPSWVIKAKIKQLKEENHERKDK